MRAPSPFCARRRRAGRPLKPSRDAVDRAQFAAKHRAGNRRGAHDRGQTGKKKRSRPARRCRACGQKKRSKSAGKPLNWMKCRRLSAADGAKSGCGWPSNGPAVASWPGYWAGAMRPRPAASGPPCRSATTATAGTSPTYSRLTPRPCHLARTALVPRVSAKPTSSKPSTTLYANAAACWCASPARSANPCPCTRRESKFASTSTIRDPSLFRPPPSFLIFNT